MRIFYALLMMLATTGLGRASGNTDNGGDNAATVIEVNGPTFYADENGDLQAVELGQLFVEGDRLVTQADASLHLVLADGSSLALGPFTELTLTKLGKTSSGQRESIFNLLKGAVNAIVEKLESGSSFEIHTAEAVAAVKGTDFEVMSDGAESSVTVQEGVVSMMDPLRRRVEAVGPLNRCSARKGSLGRAFPLPKREAGEFQQRWQRAHMIHGQRMELMKHFMKERKNKLRSLRKRRAQMGAGASLEERRKNARQRFKKRREEIKKERQEQN